MLKALITGIDGFTGRYMAAELHQAGVDIIGLSHKQQPVNIPSVMAVYHCDLCDPFSLTRLVNEIQPDLVVHLAAISFVPHGTVEDIYRTNIIGTRNLLEALSLTCRSVKSVLLASSANVYGNTASGTLDENTLPAPFNDYGVSKLAMEYIAKLFSDRLPIIITRPFNYTGAGQSERFLLPKIVNHVRRGAEVIELGNLDVARDFYDVRVVVQYYRRLLELTRCQGEVFNVCSGRAHSLKQILAMVKEISAHQFEIRVNPAFERANEVKLLVGTPAKLHAHVGVVDDIALGETLRWMLDVD